MALNDHHPDAERLAAYVEGALAPTDRVDIERHLVECADCRGVAFETMTFLENEPGDEASAERRLEDVSRVIPFRARRWLTGVAGALAVAAALALAVRTERPGWVSWVFGSGSGRAELQALIAAVANEPARPVEGRLSGGFKYALPPSVTRGSIGHRLSLATQSAAAQAAHSGLSPEVNAIAELTQGNAARALDVLNSAQRNNDANMENLRAAALIERARQNGSLDDWLLAVNHARLAIRLQPDLLEPRFNLALAQEGAEPGPLALALWRDLEKREQDPKWLAEIRQHVSQLSSQAAFSTPGQFRQLGVGDVTVDNGTDDDVRQHQTTVWGTGVLPCSATIVGPKAVILAGHCIYPLDHLTFTFNGIKVVAKCVYSPVLDLAALRGDLAMCQIEKPANGIYGVDGGYPTINPTMNIPQLNDPVTFLGYSPTDGGAILPKPVLSFGEGRVEALPTNVDDEIVVTGKVVRTGVQGLGAGDSGGPAFATTKDGPVLIAVNSRTMEGNQSFMSSVSTLRARAFLCEWAARYVPACGLRSGVPNCSVRVTTFMCE